MRNIEEINRFRDCINEIDAALPDIIQAIKSNPRPDRVNSLKRFLYSVYINKTIAHYSVGDDKEIVKKALLEAIPAFEDGFVFDDGYGDYDTMVWMVSLAILCDIEIEDFKRITRIIARDKGDDKLLNMLISHQQPDWNGRNQLYIQKYPYSFSDGISDAAGIKKYLDKHWYQGHSDAYWHNLHKNTEVNNYFGYWAWEVAAIAKIKGIDDSSLKTQKYYPYDAVHW